MKVGRGFKTDFKDKEIHWSSVRQTIYKWRSWAPSLNYPTPKSTMDSSGRSRNNPWWMSLKPTDTAKEAPLDKQKLKMNYLADSQLEKGTAPRNHPGCIVSSMQR